MAHAVGLAVGLAVNMVAGIEVEVDVGLAVDTAVGLAVSMVCCEASRGLPCIVPCILPWILPWGLPRILPWLTVGGCHGTCHGIVVGSHDKPHGTCYGHNHGTYRGSTMADGNPRALPHQAAACHGFPWQASRQCHGYRRVAMVSAMTCYEYHKVIQCASVVIGIIFVLGCRANYYERSVSGNILRLGHVVSNARFAYCEQVLAMCWLLY